MTEREFLRAYASAKEAAKADLGERWWAVPGASSWVTLKQGVVSPTRNTYGFAPRRDYRFPVAKYWPGGEWPSELIDGGRQEMKQARSVVECFAG